MNLAIVFAFLPCITCFFWLVLLMLLSSKNPRTFRLELLVFAMGTSALADAVVNNGTTGMTSLVFFMIGQLMTTCVIPIALIYLRRLDKHSEKKNSLYISWIAFPISLLFADTVLLMLAGTETFIGYIDDFRNGFRYTAATDKVEQITYLCSVWIYNAILAVEAAILLVRSFIFKPNNRHIQAVNLTALIIVFTLKTIAGAIFGKNAVWAAILFPTLLTVAVFLIAYTGLFHNIHELRYSDLLKGITPQMSDDSYYTDDDSDATTINPETVESPDNINEDRLKTRFEKLIITDQLFLKQGIRISDIAAMLDTNRTYVSRLVNNTYNMSFSDYINTLRIDYAEQYLLQHKDAKQSDLAAACGFPNASSFNNIFKKITGVTPKIWLATNNQP